ncbi:MAG TPA: hypothetical protein VM432_09350 [Bdellovibrionales bacterium]|nr:hypothetical protein [Bdellovibrionales bacterium]
MKLTRLLDLHQKHQARGIPESFGDGFLMEHNSVFRRVRDAALKHGYRFTNERNDAYETFPLLQLDSLLQQKRIPYSNNTAAFATLSAQATDALSWADLDGNLKKNFVFHEGAHAIARSIADNALGPIARGQSVEAQREFALRMLVEESCANTAELLGVSETADQAHRIFYEMNSYVCEFESRTNLKNALTEIGGPTVAKFMILAYLHANLLRESIDERSFKSITTIASKDDLNPAKLKTLRALGKIAFNLSERFRVQTTGFHLRLAGVTTPPEELFDFDYLDAIQRNQGYQALINGCVTVYTQP